MNTQQIKEIWQEHGGKIFGAGVGFLFGILVLAVGFFQGLFVLLCAGVGFFIGKRIDEKVDIVELLEKLLPPNYHR